MRFITSPTVYICKFKKKCFFFQNNSNKNSARNSLLTLVAYLFQEYEPILYRKKSGCFAVPMVHSSVLVDLRAVQSDKLHFDPNLVEDYKGPMDDIITFALSANLSGKN